MATNLIESISSYFTPEIVSKASAFLQENPANVSRAISGIIPTLLRNVTNMASAPGGATMLSGLLNSEAYNPNLLNNVSNLFGGGTATSSLINQGHGLLSTLFGNRLDSVTSAMSSFGGIGRGSTISLMAMVAPAVMAVIGKVRSAQGLNPSGLASLLSSQEGAIASAMPAGLASLTSTHEVEGLRSVTVAPMATQQAAGGLRWVPLLVLLAAVLGLLAYLFGRGRAPVPTVALEQVKLCSGNSIALASGSFNYNLARYLAQGSDSELPKTFVFDNLNFDSATTSLTTPSLQTVNDLVVILKACPDAQVQFAGHTDNTGDSAANQTLSTNRAVAIRDMLVAQGISPDRMTTVGYGQDRPIASNDTEDGKARNRRTELVVLKR